MHASGFISKAACRGYRPNRFASHKAKQRPHLIARLAKERSIARFIVAPSGYGKTSLAVDYAETMFLWTHVFWISAKSPCFIRDLDNGAIASACLEVDPEVRLVVIDDLPSMDSLRAQRLSGEIDTLLARGCEVMAVCVPSCDLLGGLQVDRIRIGAADLLLSDEEIDAVRSDEERLRMAAPQVPASSRVPALAWNGTTEATAAFVAANLDEDLPSDLLLAACSAFALRQGSLSDLAAIGPIDPQLVADAFGDYPHFGFDVETGRFEAPLVDAEALARAAKPRLDALVARSRFDSKDDLVQAWAEVLLAQGYCADRACDLVRAFCPAKQRAVWLVDHARALVRSGCFLAINRVVRSLKGSHYDDRERVGAIGALCCRMLGDEAGAVRSAKRIAFDEGAAPEARVVCLLIVARFAPGELRSRAASLLLDWAMPLSSKDCGSLAWHDALVFAWAARQVGVDELGESWISMRDASDDDDIVCLVASWLFAIVREFWGVGTMPDDRVLEAAERYVRSRLADYDAPAINFFALSAGLSMEEAHVKGMAYFGGPLEAGVLLRFRQVEMAMLAQRRAFEQYRYEEQARQANWVSGGSLYGADQLGLAHVERQAVPTLDLKLFGRFDISIGGVPVDPRRIGRKQARVLLVLLAANRGRDLSRDAVAQAMWPSRDIGGARKNFYTTWSQLRRALLLPDGTCPYLVRHQFGCRLDERYVNSDIARLDDMCRELLFGGVDFDLWLEIYKEIEREFSGELLPAEDRNSLIAKVRDEYRSRLVDALVMASQRLVEAGNPQWGIWFARSAIDREATREDAYVALMRAQIASDQRTAAMMTYLTCRRVLADELGIDPSPETTALYESLLGG